jgi:hypothetical protein
LDGRNRWAACQRAGVEPKTVVYEGDDLAESVLHANIERRHMTTGARAMAAAMALYAEGRRATGRWKRGSVPADNQDSRLATGGSRRCVRSGLSSITRPSWPSRCEMA